MDYVREERTALPKIGYGFWPLLTLSIASIVLTLGLELRRAAVAPASAAVRPTAAVVNTGSDASPLSAHGASLSPGPTDAGLPPASALTLRPTLGTILGASPYDRPTPAGQGPARPASRPALAGRERTPPIPAPARTAETSPPPNQGGALRTRHDLRGSPSSSSDGTPAPQEASDATEALAILAQAQLERPF
jgi:hypothetical protein